ncbi:hypothetical protein [Euzebya tangerina]|uniref:hypothetical protein n=1 Tax=Euzebya tangerina TaxID=591198 RepID=UPI000E31FD19|nr:hypothetical protein [Euzebya tangerina]
MPTPNPSVTLAHALPQSIGAVPLTVVLTVLTGLFLAASAASTRRVTASLGAEGSAARASTPAASTTDPASRPVLRTEAGTVGQVLGLAGLILLAVLTTFGSADPAENLTDLVAMTLLWGFVAITSIVVGPWWHRADPMRLLGRGADLALAVDDDVARPALSERVADGAAVALLVAWAGIQLLVNASVFVFQLILIAYVVVHVAGTSRFGPIWLTRTESLTVLSTTMGLLRPRDGGPVSRLTALADTTRVRLVCAVLIGWSLTDLVLETEWWHELAIVGGFATSLGLMLLIVTIAALYGLIVGTSSRVSVGPAFVAVAGGWVVAHYLSILLIDGQGLFIWLSDPLATGANYLGLAGERVDPEPIPLDLLAAIQSIPFALGHLGAVVVIQRRAARVVTDVRQLGPATFFARAVVALLLLGGIYLQLGGL